MPRDCCIRMTPDQPVPVRERPGSNGSQVSRLRSVLRGTGPQERDQEERTHDDDVYPGKDLGTLDLTITDEMVKHYITGLDEPNSWYTTASPFGGPVAPVIVYQDADSQFKGWYLDNLFGNLWRRQEWRSTRRRAWDKPCAAARGWPSATGDVIATSSHRRCGNETRPGN